MPYVANNAGDVFFINEGVTIQGTESVPEPPDDSKQKNGRIIYKWDGNQYVEADEQEIVTDRVSALIEELEANGTINSEAIQNRMRGNQ